MIGIESSSIVRKYQPNFELAAVVFSRKGSCKIYGRKIYFSIIIIIIIIKVSFKSIGKCDLLRANGTSKGQCDFREQLLLGQQ